ncbi:hypothetical protein HMPREF1990_00458 [Porphyromonas gingivalis W4087]|nr:hypothetical protein HMPREF1990_00458 [Porphyromonas gingivalis W4087]PDP75532.1 hypothetical protein CLI79_03405 [Porphyromonas gingivalis]
MIMTTASINSVIYVEIVSFFRNLLKESIEACSSNKMDVTEYKTISLDEYYEGNGWDRTVDEDGNDIEGVDIISDFIVLNDDTRTELNRAFEEARDEEFEAFINECFVYTGRYGYVYVNEEDAIEDARYDFINDKTDLNEDVSIYFDENNNPNELYKTEFAEYVKEKVLSCADALENGIEYEVLEILYSPFC